MNIEDAFEEIFKYYREDDKIRAMFEDQSLSGIFKFIDTKQIYTVNIHEDQTISLDPNTPPQKPDIRVRLKSEQIFIDLINGDLPVGKAFASGKIMIVKGFAKIARLYRKYVK